MTVTLSKSLNNKGMGHSLKRRLFTAAAVWTVLFLLLEKKTFSVFNCWCYAGFRSAPISVFCFVFLAFAVVRGPFASRFSRVCFGFPIISLLCELQPLGSFC